MTLSPFQRIYDGFEHAGLRMTVDRELSTHDRLAACWIVDVASGERVGGCLRWLFERDGLLWVRAESQFLDEPYQRRGFTSKQDRLFPVGYRELGVHGTSIHARGDGAAVWGSFGYDFDLYGIEGPDEARRRARVVAGIFSPGALRGTHRRRLPPWPKRGPNPHRVLRARERDGPQAALAVREMRARIPTEAQIESGELSDTFTTPAEIAAFEVEGVRIGFEAMRVAHWEGVRLLSEVEQASRPA